MSFFAYYCPISRSRKITLTVYLFPHFAFFCYEQMYICFDHASTLKAMCGIFINWFALLSSKSDRSATTSSFNNDDTRV